MDTINKELNISIKIPTDLFAFHIQDPLNKRILFSSGFGTGKTFFLEKFFNESASYESFHLYPVNYSVNSNEDIFNLIKYDLLFRLLAKPVEFDKVEFSDWLTFESYIHFKPIEFFKSIFGLANKLGQSIPIEVGNKLLDAYSEINNSYKNFNKSVQNDEMKEAVDYLKTQINKIDSIREHDNITELISSLLMQLKKSGKETVLIIDDLDRIDPEHIFRLLNIFAAHFDVNHGENKFGFDKVIFVCDENNIRNIFHAKYGLNVDYTGYIDKFFSKKVFDFDNTLSINGRIADILQSITIQGQENAGDFIKYFFSFNEKNLFSSSIHIIIKELVLSRMISIRSLKKIYGIQYAIERKSRTYSFVETGDYDYRYDFINIVNFLAFIFGGNSQLVEILNKSSHKKPNVYVGDLSSGSNSSIIIRQIIGNAVAIIDIDNHKFENINDFNNRAKEFDYIDEELGIRVDYSIELSDRRGGQDNSPIGYNAYIRKIYSATVDDKKKILSLNLFRLLEKAIIKLQSYKLK